MDGILAGGIDCASCTEQGLVTIVKKRRTVISFHRCSTDRSASHALLKLNIVIDDSAPRILTGYMTDPVLELSGVRISLLGVCGGGGTETGDVAEVLSFEGKIVLRPFARKTPPPTRLGLAPSLACFASANEETGGLEGAGDEGGIVDGFTEASSDRLEMGVISSSVTLGFGLVGNCASICVGTVDGFDSASAT